MINLSERDTVSWRNDAIASTLRQTSLFAKADTSVMSELVQACALIRLPKGKILFREGQRSDGFFVVQSGAICLSRVSPEGREQVISVFRPHDCFAEATLSDMDTYPANAMALEPSQVILVRRDGIRALIRSKPDLAISMLVSMSTHLKHLVLMIDDLKFKQIENRLANWLDRNASAASQANQRRHVDLPMSKKLLASRLGVTSETLSRAFARFRHEGIIEVNGRSIAILDQDAMRKYL